MNRPPPNFGARAYKTYEIRVPRGALRQVGCPDDCEPHARGWRTTVDVRTELGQSQAHYIRFESGRAFTEERTGESLVTFTFQPGQQCFGNHTERVRRQEIYIVRDGDYRGNPTGALRVHQNGSDWVDDFATHQDRVHTARERG